MKSYLKNNQSIALFLSVFVALNITFLYYNFIFFIGNHDWDWVKGTTQVLSLNTGLFEARFAKFIFNTMLFSGHIFPIINNIVSFSFLSIGAVFICKYLKINNLIHSIIISLSLVLSPYILGWLYFPINILGNFSAIAYISGGLLLLEKDNKLSKIIAILLFILALGVYPSSMEMIFILFTCKNILNPKQSKTKELKTLFYIVLSLICFKGVIYTLVKLNLSIQDYYNMQLNSVSYIITHIPTYIKLFFSQLYTTLPFFPLSLKLIGIIIVLLAFIASSFNLTNIILWMIIFVSTILTSILTANIEETAFMPRVNFYGLNFLFASSIAVLLSSSNKWRNLGYILSLIYLIISINQNLYAQKVWSLGLKAETYLTQRITKRIEDNSTQLPLVPVFTDELSLRPRYYHTSYQKNSPYLLERSFIVRHIPSGMYNFYSPTQIFYGYSQIRDLSPSLYQYLKTATQPWPHQNSLYIDDTYAVIMLTTKGITAIKHQLPK